MQQFDGEKIIDIRLFCLIIEHLVIAEYDIFVMPILTKFILQHRRGKGTNKSWANTNNMPRRSKRFQENNKWATQGNTEKTFGLHFIIYWFPSCEYIHNH
jgi:hypothetical protein